MDSRIKTKEQIDLMIKSLRIAEKALWDVQKYLKPGVTEKQIATKLWQSMKKQGAQKLAFETIVAFGTSAEDMHHSASNVKLSETDLIMIDLGCVYKGYCSDLTRTFCLKPGKREKELFNIIKKAQIAAIKAIKNKSKGCFVDGVARKLLLKAGYGKREFQHGLGHGVGTVVHENPRLRPKARSYLRTGMVVTVEPGVYLDWGGVRLEDMILVTEKGYKNLTKFPKTLNV